MRSLNLMPDVAVAQRINPFGYGQVPTPLIATSLAQYHKWMYLARRWAVAVSVTGPIDDPESLDPPLPPGSEQTVTRGITVNEGEYITGWNDADEEPFYLADPWTSEGQKLSPSTFYLDGEPLGYWEGTYVNYLDTAGSAPTNIRGIRVRLGPLGTPESAFGPQWSVTLIVNLGFGVWTTDATYEPFGVPLSLSASVLIFDGIELPLYTNRLDYNGTVTIDPSEFWPYDRADGTHPLYDITNGDPLYPLSDPEWLYETALPVPV